MAVLIVEITEPISYVFRCMVSPAHIAPYAIMMLVYYVCCIGKAVFASCPHESACTERDTLDLPANGGNVSFNATVIHTNSGSCGYQQDDISLVKLIKMNETTGGRSKISLYLCKFGTDYCPGPNTERNVSLNKGHSGFEFVLTLFNITADDIGTYKVIVEWKHPGTGIHMKLTKMFHVVGK